MPVLFLSSLPDMCNRCSESSNYVSQTCEAIGLTSYVISLERVPQLTTKMIKHILICMLLVLLTFNSMKICVVNIPFVAIKTKIALDKIHVNNREAGDLIHHYAHYDVILVRMG